MYLSSPGHLAPAAIDLNPPSHVLSWSFIDITVANLVVIAIMVVIFGAALVLRFPHSTDMLPATAATSGCPAPVRCRC